MQRGNEKGPGSSVTKTGLNASPVFNYSVKMCTINEMLRRVRSINLTVEGGMALEATEGAYLKLNKEQLMEGKTNTGRNVFPSYLEDPFFNSPESALRYSRWKDRITPNSARPSGVPNLFITGAYQAGWTISVNGGKINHNGTFPLTAAIERKFRDVRGLSPDFRARYKITYFNPELIRRVNNILYGY